MSLDLTIIICTSDRPNILTRCLQSLVDIDLPILIIDNGSKPILWHQIMLERPELNKLHIAYHRLDKRGLSGARNYGASICTTKWLFYIDDDVLLPKDYLKRLDDLLSRFPDCVCLGGPYRAKYESVRPGWISESFGHTPIREQNSNSVLQHDFLSGNNFIIQRSILQQVGGFPIQYGMSGHTIGYGEEDYVQQKLRALGYPIHFFPELYVDHLVLPHKLLLRWHLRSAFASGRDQLTPPNLLVRFYKLLHATLSSLLKRLPLGIVKVLRHKSYYWQNLVLDTSTPILYAWGLLFARKKLQNSVS